jgi:hypothetical protein
MLSGGNLPGAQAALLNAIKANVGGAAEALANPITQLKNTIEDVAAGLALVLLPSVKAISSYFGDWLSPVSESRDKLLVVGESIAEVVKWTLQLGQALGGPVLSAYMQTRDALILGASDLANVWQLAADNMSLNMMKILPGSESVFKKVGIYGAATWESISAGLSAFWEDVKAIFTQFVDLAKAVGAAVGAALAAAWNLDDPIAAAQEEFSRGIKKMADDAKQLANPLAAATKSWSNTVANATAGIDEQGGMKAAITANRDKLDQAVKDALARVPKAEAGPKVKGAEFSPTSFDSTGATAGTQHEQKLEAAGIQSKDVLQGIVDWQRGQDHGAAERAAAEARQQRLQMIEQQKQIDKNTSRKGSGTIYTLTGIPGAGEA